MSQHRLVQVGQATEDGAPRPAAPHDQNPHFTPQQLFVQSVCLHDRLRCSFAALRRLADATGGRAFMLKSFDRVDEVFAQMENELRTQYSVTFHPLSAQQCGYHSVELRPTNPRLRIHARDGYYGCRP